MPTPTRASFAPRNWVWETGVSLSGGTWLTSLPLTRLLNFDPQKKARSSGTGLSATKIIVDLGQARTANFFAFMFSNIRESSLIRYTFGNDATFATYEHRSDWLPAYPVTQPFGTRPFGVFSFGGFQAFDESDPRGVGHSYFVGYTYLARYVQIEVDDSGNDDGYVEVGVIYAAQIEEVTIQVRPGFGVEPIEVVIKDRTLGGTLHIDPLYKYDRMTFELQWLASSDMLPTWFEMLKWRGRSKPILVFLRPSDTLNLYRLGMYGVIADPPRILHQGNDYFGAQITMESL